MIRRSRKHKKKKNPFSGVRLPPFPKAGRPQTTKCGLRGYQRQQTRKVIQKALQEVKED